MDITASTHAAALWVGLHLILLLVLSVLVVRQRRSHGVVLGDGDVPQLAQAIRAFGNATEYVPAGLVAIAVLAMVGAPPMVVHATGLTLLAGRIAHAIGLSRTGDASLPRAAGVIMTWLAYILGAVALVFYAIP
ncbi:MAG: glutathione S-transferase [Phenylobacterium sp.]|nr:glutathione S-transferase [Phenylobacterium sp.]